MYRQREQRAVAVCNACLGTSFRVYFDDRGNTQINCATLTCSETWQAPEWQVRFDPHLHEALDLGRS